MDGKTTIDGRGDLTPGDDIPLRFNPEGVEGETEAPRLRRAPSSNCLYWPQIFSREVKRSFKTASLDLSWALSASTDCAKTWSAISRMDVTRGSNWLSWAYKSCDWYVRIFSQRNPITMILYIFCFITWNFVSWAFSCLLPTVKSIGSALWMSASVLSNQLTKSRMVRWYSSFYTWKRRERVSSCYWNCQIKYLHEGRL